MVSVMEREVEGYSVAVGDSVAMSVREGVTLGLSHSLGVVQGDRDAGAFRLAGFVLGVKQRRRGM